MVVAANNRMEILEQQIESLAWLFGGRPKGKQVVNDTKRIEAKIQLGKLCKEMKEEIRREGKVSWSKWQKDRKYPDSSVEAYIKLYEEELNKQPRVFQAHSGKEYTLPVTISPDTYTFFEEYPNQKIIEQILQMIEESTPPLDMPTLARVELAVEHLVEEEERLRLLEEERERKQREEKEKLLPIQEPVLGIIPSIPEYYPETARPNGRVRRELEPYVLLKHPTIENLYAIKRPSDAFPESSWENGGRYIVTLNGQHLYVGSRIPGTNNFTVKNEDEEYDLSEEESDDITLRKCTPEQIERSCIINEAWIRCNGRKITSNTQHFHFIAPSRTELIKYFKQNIKKMKSMVRSDGKSGGYQSYEVVDEKRPTMQKLFPSPIMAAGRTSFAMQAAYKERERYHQNVRDM